MSTYDETTPLPDPHEPAPADAEVESGRHPVNIGDLVMGLAFATFVVIWALLQGDVIETRDLRWLMPVPWILGGAAGLAAVAFGNRRRG